MTQATTTTTTSTNEQQRRINMYTATTTTLAFQRRLRGFDQDCCNSTPAVWLRPQQRLQPRVLRPNDDGDYDINAGDDCGGHGRNPVLEEVREGLEGGDRLFLTSQECRTPKLPITGHAPTSPTSTTVNLTFSSQSVSAASIASTGKAASINPK